MVLRRWPILTSLYPSALLTRGLKRRTPLFLLAWVGSMALFGMDRNVRAMLQLVRRERARLPLPSAQLCQDAFVLSRPEVAQRARVFIDLGASEPIEYSNTYALQAAGWGGILVDANPNACRVLEQTRMSDSVQVLHRAVAETAGEVELVEYGPLSSLASSSSSDIYGEMRERRLAEGHSCIVMGSTPSEILREANIAHEVGYLSVDLEGMDLLAIRSFPFDAYDIAVLTVEHNFDDDVQDALDDFLAVKGFRRVCRRWSGIDGWYLAANYRS